MIYSFKVQKQSVPYKTIMWNKYAIYICANKYKKRQLIHSKVFIVVTAK